MRPRGGVDCLLASSCESGMEAGCNGVQICRSRRVGSSAVCRSQATETPAGEVQAGAVGGGCGRLCCTASSSSCKSNQAQQAQLTGPAATALTRIPFGASWAARERVNATMAPLVALT